MKLDLAACVVTDLPLGVIQPYKQNPREHPEKQLKMLEASLRRSRYMSPLLLTAAHILIAGHARYLVAQRVGLATVPVIVLPHLSDADAVALRIADNAISEKGAWSLDLLSKEIQLLSSLDLDFKPIEIGFETPEVDRIILGRSQITEADDIPPVTSFADCIARPGDVFTIGNHSIACGDARDRTLIGGILAGTQAGAVITDMPWNLPANFISNKGRNKFSDFMMVSGEMTDQQFRTFTAEALEVQSEFSRPGALVFQFIDWRSVDMMISTGKVQFGHLINICVWVKQNGRMGSPYRSRHEFVCVFRNKGGKSIDNVQLGVFGRNRTNVWEYQAPSAFGSDRDQNEMHPTCKNVQMIADAILDCTDRGEIVLDPFLGSGTVVLAAHQTGRVGIGIELDPRYVDLAVRRAEKAVGSVARSSDGLTVAELRDLRRRES
jgi:hypothetical protein